MMTPDPNSRFAIIPVIDGRAAPDEAIVVGPMNEVMEYIPQSVARQDTVEELEKARFTADQISSLQQKTRAVQASMLADSVNHLSARLDSFLQRRADEEREAERAREEAEAQRIASELAQLPDPDAPDPLAHQPTGDLHSLSAKDEEELEKEDQAEFELPEDPSGPKGTVVPQPVAVEFD